MAFRIGILGGSGYTGVELLRLLAAHPALEVAHVGADSNAGNRVADVAPGLAAAYGDLRFGSIDVGAVDGLDLVFCCLPHGASGALVADMLGRVGHVVDLGADFRLRDPAAYPRWYGAEHPQPALLAAAAYGLPELFREPLRGAELVAAAGCYVTAASLALAPFVRAGAVEASGVVVDAFSGASGAGRAPKANLHFCSVDEDLTAYGLLTHRHTPEIEQATGAQVLFTPHLAPTNRGILATVYARAADTGLTTEGAIDLLATAYAGEPFVTVAERPPSTKATLGSNVCQLTARVDERTGWLVAIAALDNLVKGASGQALQCANLALGLDEALGLPLAGLTP
ncbi:MAG: N-acetyl-gamma-glutamyl-phosphate reductase [Acidimicrobiales bacterium]